MEDQGDPRPADAPSIALRREAAATELLDIAGAITGDQTIDEILDLVVERFRSLVPFDRVEFAEIREHGEVLVTRWVWTAYTDVKLDVGYEYRRVPERPPFGSRPEPAIEIDTALIAAGKPAQHPSHRLLEEGIRCGLSCPLVVGPDRVGYLFFCSRSPDAYDSGHLWLLEQVSRVLADAIRRRDLMAELEARNRELEDLAEFRTRFLAAVSHELRTPLTAVVGLASTLRDQPLPDEERHELTRLLAEQAAESAAITEDLLVLARAEAGELSIAASEIDITAEVQTVATSLGMDLEVRGEAPPVLGDATRVRQILRNLLTNTSRHGGRRVWVQLEAQAGASEVSVCDDGPGVPEPVLANLFQPFRGVGDDGPTARSGSVGVGLWVSHTLARRMGGDLVYRRGDGTTCFTLSLPLSS